MKKVGIIKRIFALLLIFLLSINSFAAVVSDNDGSAFITKAEFDSLKNNFQAQIDQYNTSIDSKIDGAIAAYLAGITMVQTVYSTPLYYTIYGKTPTFHRNDSSFWTAAYKTEVGHETEIWNAYTINFKFAKVIYHGGGTQNGAFLGTYDWKTPENTWKYIVRADWDDALNSGSGGWRFRDGAENATIVWNWSSVVGGYSLTAGNPERYWAWFKANNWKLNPIAGRTSGFGDRGTDFYAYIGPAGTGNKTYDEINTASAPSWATGNTSWNLTLDPNGLTEVDNNKYSSTIEHLWVDSATQSNRRINRKIEIIDWESAVRLEPMKQEWTCSYTNSNVRGAFADPKIDNTVTYMDWKNVYGPTFTGSTSTSYTDKQNNTIRSNNLFYEVDDVPGLFCFSDTPVFDKVQKCNGFSFDITLEDTGYANATLYMTTAKTNLLNPTASYLPLKKNNGAPANTVSLAAGEKTTIRVDHQFNNGDVIYFGIQPPASNKAKIREVSDYTIYLGD